MGWKICGKCKLKKDATDFHNRSASVDGLSAMCKECQRAYDAARLDDKARAAKRNAYAKTAQGKARRRDCVAAWIQRNPEKRKAQVVVGNAIRDGKLIRQPCEDCGKNKSQAHHDDYSRPLVVRWKCARCHAKHHRDERAPAHQPAEGGLAP